MYPNDLEGQRHTIVV